MKKTVILALILCFICIIIFFIGFNNIKNTEGQIKQFNSEFEQYQDKIILGSNIATAINKAVDNNEKYNITKLEDNRYQSDEKFSVRIFVKLEENGQYFDMERIDSVGIGQFVKNFSLQDFKCSKIVYHSKTKRVSEVYFDVVEE